MSEAKVAGKTGVMWECTDKVGAYLSSIVDDTFPETYRLPVSVTKLTTGIANEIHRLTFGANQTDKRSSAIIKHSPPYVLNSGGHTMTWDLWPFELHALQDVPNTEFVKTPKVYWVDSVNRVTITEDAGPGSINLKDLLLREDLPNAEVFKKIGAELGKFLLELHAWGRSSDNIQKFENKDSRTIASWRTFGRLEDTMVKIYPELSEERKQSIKLFSEKEKTLAISGKEHVIMGDFWTGNVLVNLTEPGDLESLYIVDWEMVRPGDAATEISQMLAEVWEGGEFGKNDHSQLAAQNLATALCSAYKKGAGNLEEDMTKRVILAAGAHVMVWASIGYAKYGDERQFKEVRDSAAAIMWNAIDGGDIQTEEWGFKALENS